MTSAVVVFVKTPGLTPAKTRLAKVIGAERALEFYRLSIEVIRETVSCFCAMEEGFVPFWSVAEKEGMGDSLWADFEIIEQSAGGLGERLSHVYEDLYDEYDRIYFLGADCPQISIKNLEEADNKMDNGVDFVVGLAEDGGYYLYAGQRRVPPGIWRDTPYSCETTAEVFIDQLRSLGRIETIGELRDIDTYDDLLALVALWRGAENLSPSQSALNRWLQSFESESD